MPHLFGFRAILYLWHHIKSDYAFPKWTYNADVVAEVIELLTTRAREFWHDCGFSGLCLACEHISSFRQQSSLGEGYRHVYVHGDARHRHTSTVTNSDKDLYTYMNTSANSGNRQHMNTIIHAHKRRCRHPSFERATTRGKTHNTHTQTYERTRKYTHTHTNTHTRTHTRRQLGAHANRASACLRSCAHIHTCVNAYNMHQQIFV